MGSAEGGVGAGGGGVGAGVGSAEGAGTAGSAFFLGARSLGFVWDGGGGTAGATVSFLKMNHLFMKL